MFLKAFSTPFKSVSTALLALILAVSDVSLAAKPPADGGGGGGTVPAGTIYFEQGDFPSASRSMKADGSGKVAGLKGEPSHQLHDGIRWSLTTRLISPELEPSEYELIAISDQGHSLSLGLTNTMDFGGRWAKDDSFLSYEATVEGPDGPSAGVYIAQVDWNLGVPLIGAPVKVLNINLDADLYPDTYGGDWSPLGDEYVYVRETQTGTGSAVYSLEVVTFFNDGTTETRGLVSDSFGFDPEWSPDGTQIAYQGSGGIWTIRPDGTGAVKISSASWPTTHHYPHWSPDSEQLVFTQSTRNRLLKGQVFYTYSYDILRISATGSGKTNLTSDTADNCFAIGWR